MAEQVPEGIGESGAVALVVQTDKRYFPLGLQDVESGPIPLTGVPDGERDFPRQLLGDGVPFFQYPVLAAFRNATGVGRLFVLSSPYFFLLDDILKGFRRGGLFSTCLGVDVRRTFSKLKSAKVSNGTVKVRSGRMVVVGLPNLRVAEFSGDNVIESPLYSELLRRPEVTITPKDCRLGRDYDSPVGGNRRRFVSWFDEHGNFRLTPGVAPSSAVFKFFELLEVLGGMELVRDAENVNPLTRARTKRKVNRPCMTLIGQDF